MQITHTDIIKRNGRFWISQRLLLAEFPELTETYMRTAARPRYKNTVADCFKKLDTLPDTGSAWRYAKIDGQFYYAYDNIPDKLPAMYKSNLPRPAELENMMQEARENKATSDVETFIKKYAADKQPDYLHCYTGHTKIQQQNLATACAYVEAICAWIREQQYNIKSNDLFNQLSDIFQKEDIPYLPHNYRKLKERLLPVLNGDKAIAESVWLPRADNANAKKYDDAEVESWILNLRDMGQNFTNAFIIRKINELCTLWEKPRPSDRWIGGIMQRPNVEFLTTQNRFGDKSSHGVRHRDSIPLAKAQFAGDCWEVDATRFNIIPHQASAEMVGEAKAKKPQYMFTIQVRDVYSGDIIGVEWDYRENRWAYISALAMAVKETGYLPYELRMDKFPGHNTPEFQNFVADLHARGVKVTFTSKTTGKARLERHFGTLQTVFMQHSEFYYGQGIRSRRRYAHRSEKYLAAISRKAKADGYDFAAATHEGDQIISKYRNTPLSEYSRKYATITKSPRQLHEESEKPNVKLVEARTYSYLFGLKKKLQIVNNGLLFTEIYKTEFIYRITDYNIISRYKEVLVCYDLEDLSFCHLYEVSDSPMKKYLGVAEDNSRAQTFGPDAEGWGSVQKQKAIIADINQLKLAELSMKKAVGDDIVAMLTPGTTNKDVYGDAETFFTNSELMTPVIGKVSARKSNAVQDDDGDMNVDPRSEY